jgi:hypothetical protein
MNILHSFSFSLPIAIFVLSKPIIQTRNGVSTAVCSIDVLNGMINTRQKQIIE